MTSAQCQKPTTTIEICQPKSQHSSFGQKISEMTGKAFKGHHARHGSSQNQLQCYNQTQVESHDHNNSKTKTHYFGQTQTKHDKKHGVSKTQITVSVVQAQITQTYEDPSPKGTTTTCFGSQANNVELNNKKERNLFRRIKNGISRHNNEGNNSSSSSSIESDSDDEKCPKSKANDERCPTSKANDEKCPKSKN